MRFFNLAILSLAWRAAANNSGYSNCKDVTFTVSGSATNRNITGIDINLSLQDLLTFYKNAPLITITGSQTLAGTYCAPTVKNRNNDKLEVFFGSIVADRGGWQAQGTPSFPPYQPDKYSWVQYANNLGYPTLALDRLGTGLSSHPDPLLVCQAPYEIAIYNDLAKQIRAGSTGCIPKYDHLVYVGNSYGSQLGAGIAGTHADAFDEIILTGFSYNFLQDFLGVGLTLPLPAQVVDPARFGTLPIGYLTTSSKIGRTNSFFGSHEDVDFTDKVAELFFERKDCVSLGQFISIYAIPFAGPGFPGRVFVLNGEQDQAACGPGSPLLGKAHCTPITQQTGILFPNAQYNWKTVDRTGHAIQLHETAQTVFKIAHDFLGGASFKGGPPA